MYRVLVRNTKDYSVAYIAKFDERRDADSFVNECIVMHASGEVVFNVEFADRGSGKWVHLSSIAR